MSVARRFRKAGASSQMKPVLKTILVLVATFGLLSAELGWVSSLNAAPLQKAGCCGDQCPPRCCIERSEELPKDAQPAVPVSAPMQQLQALLLPRLVEVTAPLALNPAALGIDCVFSSPLASGVPLFLRTHSFLI
jgi:hypothetical protein